MVVAGIKTLAEVRIGDTLTDARAPAPEPLPRLPEREADVFTGPVSRRRRCPTPICATRSKSSSSTTPRSVYEPETSGALGFGFRCGFLGFLHSEIIQERLEREYNLDLISTRRPCATRVVPHTGEPYEIETPAAMPAAGDYQTVEEPMILATLHLPPEYVGAVLALCEERRGKQRDMSHHGSRIQLRYELPLSEVVLDFHDRIKSATRGYGSFDYDLIGYQPPTSCARRARERRSRRRALADRAPRQGVPARHRSRAQAQGVHPAPAVRGGDPGRDRLARDRAHQRAGAAQERHREVLRRRHQPQAQAAREAERGKAAHEAVGSVEIPQEAFLAALRLDDE
jgi:GTP-binding protein LepA